MELVLLFQPLEDGVPIYSYLILSFKSVEMYLHALSLLHGRVL